MKRSSVFLAIMVLTTVFTSTNSFASKSEESEDLNSYRLYFPNGNIEEVGHWEKHRNVGEFKRYHKNGELAQWFQFNQYGVRDGVQKYFHENGQIRLIGNWNNGSPEGVVRVYNTDGILVETMIYSRGELIKKSIRTYETPYQF